MTSCGGHRARVDLSVYYSSANTLTVQDGMQLAIAKFGLSVKDCQFQASFNDSTTKGPGPKVLA